MVNKADRPEAENTARALKVMLEMAKGGGSIPTAGKHFRSSGAIKKPDSKENSQASGWQIPIWLVTATEGKGVETLIEDINRHKNFLISAGLWKVKEAHRLEKDLEALVKDQLMHQWQEDLDQGKYQQILSEIIQRKCSPIEALDRLL